MRLRARFSLIERVTAGLLAVVLCAAFQTQLARSQEASSRDGMVISVPNPITDVAVRQIEDKIKDALERKKRNINTIVFDFNPNGQPAATSTFGAPHDLASLIVKLRFGRVKDLYPKMTTVGFVSAEVAKHTLLPLLACDQIIMSGALDEQTRLPRARIGSEASGLPNEMDASARAAYAHIAGYRDSPDLVARLLNPHLEIHKVKALDQVQFVSLESLHELSKTKDIIDLGVPTGLEKGISVFDPEQARAIGLCKAIYNTKQELVDALGLPRQSLVEDWLIDRVTNAHRIDVRGPLDKGQLASLERSIGQAVQAHANFLILNLDAEEGDVAEIATLANVLRNLKDENGVIPVKTVAYVPVGRSIGAATFLALGCNEIVMAHGSSVGDFSYLDKKNPDELKRYVEMIVPLARVQGYSPLLFQATLDRNLVLYRVRSRSDPGREQLITEKDFRDDEKSPTPRWSNLGRIDRGADPFLKITLPLAREFHVSTASDIDSLEALNSYYGVEPKADRGDWLARIATFCREEPAVKFFLIMVGILGLILELKLPGTTVPGVIAAICFVLFFWAYSFVGNYTLLAVFLFVLGLAFIVVEIFIIPGVGFVGVSGVVLLVVSLVLGTLAEMPKTSQDWINLGSTMSSMGMSMVAALLSAVTIAHFLPNIPYANRLVLQPPTAQTEREEEELHRSSLALLGAIGLAVTPLRPAGKVQFGDDFLDVIAEGDYINPGQRVQVIEIEGKRVVVKEI